MWNMIDFNMLDRFGGPTRIKVSRALKKMPILNFSQCHIESPSCLFASPKWCAHCPDEEVMSREVKWIGKCSYSPRGISPPRTFISWLLPEGFCTQCFRCFRFIRILVKMHIHRLYGGFTELEPLRQELMNLHFPPQSAAHHFAPLQLAV